VLQNHLRSRISKGAPTSPFEASLGEREAALVNKTRSRYIFENRILNASGFQRRDSRRKHPGRREKGPRLKTGTSKPHIKQGPEPGASSPAMASEAGRPALHHVRFKRADLELTQDKCDVSLQIPVSEPMRGVLQSYGVWEYQRLSEKAGSSGEQTGPRSQEEESRSRKPSQMLREIPDRFPRLEGATQGLLREEQTQATESVFSEALRSEEVSSGRRAVSVRENGHGSETGPKRRVKLRMLWRQKRESTGRALASFLKAKYRAKLCLSPGS